MNVRVNGIAPGIVKTPMVQPMGEEVVEQLCHGMHLTKKVITTDQVQVLVQSMNTYPTLLKRVSARYAILHRQESSSQGVRPNTPARSTPVVSSLHVARFRRFARRH